MEIDLLPGYLPQMRKIRRHCQRVSEFKSRRGREASMSAMWRKTSWTMLDTKLHIMTQRFTERRWKGGRKGEPKGKSMVQERKDNVSTKSQNLQKNSGQADHGNSGQINPGKLTPTVRAGERMTGTQQSRVLMHQQQLKNFNMRHSGNCDFRIFVLPLTSKLFSVTDWTLPSEPLHLALIRLHAKLLFLPFTRRLIHKDSSLGCAYQRRSA